MSSTRAAALHLDRATRTSCKLSDSTSGQVVRMAHPPIWVKNGKGKIVHHSVGMVISVRPDLHAHAEAGQAQIEVGADCALDANAVCDVALAVVAVKHRPAGCCAACC